MLGEFRWLNTQSQAQTNVLRRKAEVQDLSQMMFAILKSNANLAKNGSSDTPRLHLSNGVASHEHSRTMSSDSLGLSNLSEPSLNLANLTLNGEPVQASSGAEIDNGDPYMFIPPDPQAYYRQVVKAVLIHGAGDDDPTEHGQGPMNPSTMRLPSKKSSELLYEIGMRWRLPLVSRLLLFKDIIRELLSEEFINLDALDASLEYIKEQLTDQRSSELGRLSDPNQWPIGDRALNREILASVHDHLLREFFEEMIQCFDKPPEIGPIKEILDTRIYNDREFPRSVRELNQFSDSLDQALLQKAHEIYGELYSKDLRPAARDVEFFDVMQLGKDVVKQAAKIQKRFRKSPQIMGVEPAVIFVKVMLPAFASDANEQVSSILRKANERQEDIPMEDGFELYKNMVEMRQIHHDVLPGVEFSFHIEGLLAPFVWRWIATTDQSIVGWVEAAVRQDSFRTRNEDPHHPPNEEERHSVSAIDIFRSFNQVIDQIVQLDWNDELQYAKFMTALSKSIGAGLTRYCEQLERFFIQEMDRLTPEQEATTTQTRHEKWVRIAKDAMSAKERMEPFQFLPEVSY